MSGEYQPLGELDPSTYLLPLGGIPRRIIKHEKDEDFATKAAQKLTFKRKKIRRSCPLHRCPQTHYCGELKPVSLSQINQSATSSPSFPPATPSLKDWGGLRLGFYSEHFPHGALRDQSPEILMRRPPPSSAPALSSLTQKLCSELLRALLFLISHSTLQCAGYMGTVSCMLLG